MSVGAWGVSLVVGLSLWSAQRLRDHRMGAEARGTLEDMLKPDDVLGKDAAIALPEPRADTRFDELSGDLKELVRGSARLRLLLEGPAMQLVRPEMGFTPWARRDVWESWDVSVVDLRRAIWVWRAGFARLDPVTCVRLRALGLQAVPLNRLLLHDLDREDNPWDPGLWARAPDRSRVASSLRAAWLELRRFEQVALACTRSSYRVPA